jgi:peptide deformylase
VAVLSLVPNTDPILKTKLDEFDFVNPIIDPIQLATDLTETMLANNGMGLAANQVGINARVFVIAANPVIAVFNPRIVDQGIERVMLDEGCLSWPGIICKIKRPANIRVRYEMPNSETVTHKYSGMTARIFQHELDHLDGIVWLSRATLYHRQKAMKKVRVL